MATDLPEGYQIRLGSPRDRTLLLKFISLSYQELFPQQQDFAHLQQTVAQYFSSSTRLWWVEVPAEESPARIPIACLWMGNAIDQVSGERYAHIFLLYVTPEHRCRGIASALMHQAQEWAKTRGDRQIGLQVFPHNQPALKLYYRLGYQTHSLLMLKFL